jgi:methylenetetrahydrofolate reductase (NADPH)
MKAHNPTYSIEFFPPKTDQGQEKLINTRDLLGALNPAFISVTFGAGGSTQQGTFDTIKGIKEAGIDAAPHLSCVGSTRQNVLDTLNQYIAIKISRIVALRGDLPSGMGGVAGEFRFASELVNYIRQKTGDHFQIEVAAYPEFHPQAKSVQDDLANLKRKVDAGANSAITQYFFNTDAYYSLVDSCQKLAIDIPIVPGIMPITNYKQLARFSSMCGAEIPQWIRKRLEGYADDIESIRSFGYDVILKLCDDLISHGVPGLHFYSMNQVDPTRRLWQELGLSKAPSE